MLTRKLGGVLMGLLCCGYAIAKNPAVVQVSEVYARPTIAGQTQGGGFLTMYNPASEDDVLVGAEVPKKIAKRAELHTQIQENGVMKMRAVKGGIAIGGKTKVELKPGGLHIMFLDLQQPLEVGKKIPLTLKFKRGKSQTVQMEVLPLDKTAPQQRHH